jgi:hypothetical protein
VIQSAVGNGYMYVDNAAALTMATGSHVLGLFNDGNMRLEWKGLMASPSPGSGLPDGQTCQENQRPANDTTRPGSLSTLLTKVDKSMMTVNYGTRQHTTSQDHTGRRCGLPRKDRRRSTWWA